MHAIKGLYHDGLIDLIEKPAINVVSEVLVIFPEKIKKIKKIGGLYKNYDFNDNDIKQELKKLNQESEKHIIKELKD